MEKGNRLFHKLDYWVGIPLVFTFGLFKRKPSTKQLDKVDKIAILNIGSIGDNVLMSAAISDIHLKYPEATIDIYTGSTNFQLVQMIPGVNSIVKLPITNPRKAVNILRGTIVYDLFLDFGPWPRLNAIFSFFVKAKLKIGFKSKKQFRHYIYDIFVEHSPLIHEIDNYRALITPICDKKNSRPVLRFKGSEKSAKMISSLGKFCIIHAWPGGFKSYLKEWNIPNWVDLVGRLATDFDHIVITGAPGDVDKSELLFNNVKMIVEPADKVLNIAGKFNLEETTHLISACSLIISVNTGIAHIAAALDKQQICLNGPTNVLRWSPFSDKTISVTPDFGACGYLNFGFEYRSSDDNCMNNILADKVYKAYLSLK